MKAVGLSISVTGPVCQMRSEQNVRAAAGLPTQIKSNAIQRSADGNARLWFLPDFRIVSDRVICGLWSDPLEQEAQKSNRSGVIFSLSAGIGLQPSVSGRMNDPFQDSSGPQYNNEFSVLFCGKEQK